MTDSVLTQLVPHVFLSEIRTKEQWKGVPLDQGCDPDSRVAACISFEPIRWQDVQLCDGYPDVRIAGQLLLHPIQSSDILVSNQHTALGWIKIVGSKGMKSD